MLKSLSHLFNDKVEIEPAVCFAILLVDAGYVLALADWDALVEKDNSLFSGESVDRVADFPVNLELHDLTQLPNSDIIRHMESKEETANFPLRLNHLLIDALNDHRK